MFTTDDTTNGDHSVPNIWNFPSLPGWTFLSFHKKLLDPPSMVSYILWPVMWSLGVCKHAYNERDRKREKDPAVDFR